MTELEQSFDLGDAIGSYEQAQNDQNFYLNMINMGQNNRGAFMASPIAAYLSGISNVKMANARKRIIDIQDQRQAEKDAMAVAQEGRKRSQETLTQMVKIASDPNVSPSVKAGMIGLLGKQSGTMQPISYDADNGVYRYKNMLTGEEEYMNFGEMSPKIEAGVKRANTGAELNTEKAVTERARRGTEYARQDLLKSQAGLTEEKAITEREMRPFNKMHKQAQSDFLNKKIESLPDAEKLAEKWQLDAEYRRALIDKARTEAKAAETKASKSGGSDTSASVQLNGFKTANKGIIEAITGQNLLGDLERFSDENIQGFLDNYEPWMKMDSAFNALVSYVLNQQKEGNRTGIMIPKKDYSDNNNDTEIVDTEQKEWF